MQTNQTNTKPLVKEVLLDAPVERVWKALTDKNEMKHWYFDLEEFKPQVGFTFQFTGGKDDKIYVHICQIKEIEVNKKIVHTWTYEEMPEAETTVTWELFREGDKTRLRLTHEGLEKLPQNKDFAVENFVQGWNHILGVSLVKYFGQQ